MIIDLEKEKGKIFSKRFFVKKLKLYNFMLHRETVISLGERPITLITGANGTGKTQILDALILALGGHPRRLKKGKMTDAIGSFGSEARVEMLISNPFINQARVLKTTNTKINKWIDKEEFSIIVEIDAVGVNYFLDVGKKHRVLRKEIRELLGMLNLRAENRLAFTEEGTVNIFSDHSSKNKLDLLLETTGLDIYRDNIATTLDSIEKAANALEPLRRRLTLEQQYFERMEKAKQLMDQKNTLLAKYEDLLLEEAWSHAREIEIKLNELTEKLEEKYRENEKILNERRRLEKKADEQKERLDQLEDKSENLRHEIEKNQKQIQILQGENRSNERLANSMSIKQTELEKQEKTFSDKILNQKIEEIQEKLSEIEKNKMELNCIREKLGEKFFSEESAYERLLIKEAISMRSFCQEEKILGPIFCELKVESAEEKRKISDLIGLHLFSFIATTKTAFKRAVLIWEEKKPPFSLVYIPQKRISSQTFSSKTLQAPDVVLHFLFRILQIDFSSQEGKTFLLLDKAEKEKKIFWKKGQLFFPFQSIGGAFCLHILDYYPEISLNKIYDAIQTQNNYENFVEEHALKETLAELKSEKAKLDQILEQRRVLQKEMDEIKLEIKENLKKIEILQGFIENDWKKHTEICLRIDESEKNWKKQNRKFQKLQNDQEGIEKIIIFWQQSREEKENKHQEMKLKAEELGKCPDHLRSAKLVTEEKLHLAGRLESLDISPIQEEDYLSQKEKVEKLQKELAGSSDHIGNLRNDVESRFSEWYTEVMKRMQSMSENMKQLVASIIPGVRLKIDNIRKPSKAGLHIQVKRHSDRWHDLSHLSGGEKVLVVEALILSLHLQTNSPLHAIDECTQRLDIKFKAQAFEMVQRAIIEIDKKSLSPFSPQFILLAPDTMGIENSSPLYFKHIVLAPARLEQSKKAIP